VRSAGTISPIGMKEHRHKPARRPPGGVCVAPVPPSPVDAEREQADIRVSVRQERLPAALRVSNR